MMTLVDEIELGHESRFLDVVNSQNTDIADRRAAADALGLLHPIIPATAPSLIAALKDPDRQVRAASAAALGRRQLGNSMGVAALADAVADVDPEVRFVAVSALGWFGKAALRALEPLIGALRDSDWIVRVAAVTAMGQIRLACGEAEVLRPLINALIDHRQHPEVCAAAASILGRIQPTFGSRRAASEIIDALIGALGDRKHPEVRAAGASALGQLKASGSLVVEALLPATRDDHVSVRAAAVGALEQIGPMTQAAGQALVACLSDNDNAVQSLAARALKKVGRAAFLPLCAVMSDLKASLEIRQIAAAVLKAVASDMKQSACEETEGVRLLVNALRDPNRELRSLVVDVLAAMGHHAKAAAEALEELIYVERTGPLAFAALMLLEQIAERESVEKGEKISRAAERINEAVARLPAEERLAAKTEALMAELPVSKNYEAFDASWDHVNQGVEEAFTSRLGQALTHHLSHQMKHGSHEDKKSSSVWFNQVLREHKRALAFPGTGEPSNLRALLGGGYRYGKYCIERRSDHERTSPQELEELLPTLQYIQAAPRQRATKEEMLGRSLAERELKRRGCRREREK